jgi:hypothetical protein
MRRDQLFPSRFLKASDLQGRSQVVVIEGVALEEIGDDKKTKPVMSFRNRTKAFVINATNYDPGAALRPGISGAVSNTRLSIRKLREGEAGIEAPFTVKTVEIGTDSDGEAITRKVIHWGQTEQTGATKPWAKSLRLLHRVLITALDEAGREVRPFADGPVVRACDLEVMRAEFYKQYPAEPETRQKQFRRAVTSAQNHNLVAIRELDGTQLVWLASSS